MSIWESIKTAWQSISASKMRSALTMLGIVIGVFAVVLLVALGQVQIAPQNYPAFLSSSRTAFIVFAILCFGGTFASLARGKSRQAGDGAHQRNMSSPASLN
jgi:hypothetical protein